ncbi:hypothetical protein F383_13247 [Gossypium arboreum]|uniref:Uncharacterized protein n=1 Tax=Gossypium arboreum TaxID=29729 RepID=A0A0B0MTS8_GOSAR|nr:hypothetical protein F383_31617 [Gossypium arboreum]KHG29447.1 hypothetical protein F383_13247 [Gossypium arboreum]
MHHNISYNINDVSWQGLFISFLISNSLSFSES